MFPCSGNTCLHRSYDVCNGVPDCENGEDEQDCSSASGGKTNIEAEEIEANYKNCCCCRWCRRGHDDGDGDDNNGDNDAAAAAASDDADSDQCFLSGSCASGLFTCFNTGACIPSAWVCDGRMNCANDEDTNLCSKHITIRQLLP